MSEEYGYVVGRWDALAVALRLRGDLEAELMETAQSLNAKGDTPYTRGYNRGYAEGYLRITKMLMEEI